MGTLAQALTTPYKDPRRKCGLGEWLKTLDEADAQTALDAIADPVMWPATTLAPRWRASGFLRGYNVISIHRRHQCACYDAA